MGLIRAAKDAISGLLADSWREFFYCDALEDEILVTKGNVQTKKNRGSNTKGNENIISNGSVIAVNEGQCMIIVDQGKVVDVCAEGGEFIYDSSTEPSLFFGSLGKSIAATFKQVGARFSFGGQVGKDQRIYFFNIKEILSNRFGTAVPIPFRVVDQGIGLDMDISLRCNGEYSFQMVDPLLFYKNVCGNVTDTYTRSQLAGQMKAEMLTALAPAFAQLSTMGVRYSAIGAHTANIATSLNEALSEKWRQIRGLEIVSLSFNSITAPPEDEEMIQELQRKAVFRNAGMAAATLAEAQAEAMKSAAANQAVGPMFAFTNMNAAMNAGGMNMNQLYEMDAANKKAASPSENTGAKQTNAWQCSCGMQNTGKFCMDCGSKKPESKSWTCTCGTQNTGKFCEECGQPKPASTTWTCACGMVNQGKFCAQCGNPRT